MKKQNKKQNLIHKRYDALGKARKNAKVYKGLELKRSRNIIISKDIKEQPIILIKSRPAGIIAKKVLENLVIEFSQPFTIETSDKKKFHGIYSSVTLKSTDDQMLSIFFQVMESLLTRLKFPLSDDHLEQKLNKLIDIFQYLKQAPRSSSQGLWAELFLISISKDIRQSILCWHDTASARYDFSKGKNHIEVKSTLSVVRNHHFSLSQAHPRSDDVVVIASFLMQEDTDGTSISDLIEKIKRGVRGKYPEILEKIDKVCYQTLGKGYKDAMSKSYDSNHARQHLCYFDLKNILKIDKNYLFAKGISNVSFTSDLGYSKAIKKSDYRKKSQLFRISIT